ncbi:flagellar type III secretion system protein FliR [Candidatus Liberibacter africanus]|uniref:Flagellar biosynthesis protein FliR n=1 Tax=Candidatus Liberibacter africanus PTSAPSY TaxID=1277257 RepID=A0A0G3I3G6_LIBAF|nr:flagellar biosynthetic protein FliR [Candidatus Liberibacter africanus]AKK20384.1 flagellar biosynthesis protein FliR [Candidatus Liberibacter africanus PTSAPSY]QTP64120.1 flagellar type III secretion system protein FliR [Candidatus Liberibacter africanus]
MIIPPEIIIMSLFLIVCRIGSCMMLLPGLSMAYIPMQVRLCFAMAFSIVLLPFLWDTIDIQNFEDRSYYLKLVMLELFLGCVYGLSIRVYTLGLQFVGGVISTAIGLNLQPSMGISDSMSETPFSSFIGIIGLLALWVTDFHHYIFEALVKSYGTIAIGKEVDFNGIFFSFVDMLRMTFIIMLRLSGPFLFFCIVFNISIGLLNKLVPQIPVYFISTPYLIGLGSLFLYLLIENIVHNFARSFLYGVF